MQSIVLTLIGSDRPGLVELLAQTVAAHDGNWLESRMSHLAGQFAGILRAEVPEARCADLVRSLHGLESEGLRVLVEMGDSEPESASRPLRLELVGTDRPGIVREVSQALASRKVNVDELQTGCSTAPMSAEPLFRAVARLRAPVGLSLQELRGELEKISSDLMVDIELGDAD